MERCRKIEDKTGRLVRGEDKVRETWKEHFEDQHNADTKVSYN